MIKVVHLTTVHQATDTRIYQKECRTLARSGYEVVLVAQNEIDLVLDGVRIKALSRPKNRLTRILGLTWQTFRLSYAENAAVYHFHDPELLLIGVLLKLFSNGSVIYDVHEDVPQQILNKHWIPVHLRRPIAVIFNVFEKLMAQALDSVVVATEGIADKFAGINPVIVHNYPDLKMLPAPSQSSQDEKGNVVVYIGGINRIRGAFEMVSAFEILNSSYNARLDLIGRFEPSSLEAELLQMPGCRHVRFLGWLAWDDAWKRAQDAMAGIVLFHPVPNHVRSLPNKLFEYMAARLPIITSSFPLWKEIVEGNHCGLTVDPKNPKEIAEAIEYLVIHRQEAQRMGENGRRAVVEKYNWQREAENLLRLYVELLKK